MSAVLESVLDDQRRADCARNDHNMREEFRALAALIKARHAANEQPVRRTTVTLVPSPAPLPSMEQYCTALGRHDWWHQMSDQTSVLLAGQASLARICTMRDQIDADCAVWNSICPPEFARRPA